MKLHREYLFAIVGVAALCIALSSSAMTLGRAKGSVFLGQALRLTVPIQMEVGEGASALCFEADVFYGDTRQDASRVSVNSEFQTPSQSANVTVVAQATVDEPVVSVYLRTVCEGKATRRYVLLAEPSPNAVAPQSMFSTAAMPPAPPTISVFQVPASSNVESNGAIVARAHQRTTKASTEAKPDTAPQFGPIPRTLRVEDHRPRLKLAPVDLSQDGDPILKLSGTLVVDEAEDSQKRARALALWRALNATPQEILAAQSRQQAMEADLKGLHEITVKNRQVLEDLTRQLSRADAERYSNPLVYGLFAAVIVCGLVIAQVWRRTPRRGPWWRDDGAGELPRDVDFSEDCVPNPSGGTVEQPANTASPPPVAPASSTVEKAVLGVSPIDIDLGHGDDPLETAQHAVAMVQQKSSTRAEPDRPAPQQRSGQVDFGQSMSASLRSVNTQEMLDVRQQAEFFMTLGQHEEAVAMLRGSVDEGAKANPLVYLELLKVLHTLGRKDDYDHYRKGFNAIFNGHVPTYANFTRSGSGLEAYPEVCRRIVSLWPAEEAIEFIETCLVRTRKENLGQDFDLEAFHDLLMLHGLASRITSSSFDSGFMAFSAAKTEPIPIAAASLAEVDFDLELSARAPENLIDFDTSGWSLTAPVDSKPKPL